MKALFLIFHGLAAHNGISKKILYQVDALRQCSVDTQLCYLTLEGDGTQRRMIDNAVLEDYGNGIMAKVKKRVCYSKIADYIIDNHIDMVYVRSAHNANPIINRMVGRIHRHGVKVVMEIPTYPYEGQFKASSRKDKLRLRVDILSRNAMARYLDRIVTFTDLPTIFGVPTISISNGIDFGQTPIKTTVNDTTRAINLIGVAELHYWHGFDRLIEGLAEYYTKPRSRDVIFNIVGRGVYSELTRLQAITQARGLADRVVFHGTQSGEALDALFEMADMGVASLARHRSNIVKIKTLKNREYAARGIPFVYSETDDDFDAMPYVMKVPADESPIDIDAMINFYDQNKMSPQQIRATISDKLSWKMQMQKVIDQTFE